MNTFYIDAICLGQIIIVITTPLLIVQLLDTNQEQGSKPSVIFSLFSQEEDFM